MKHNIYYDFIDKEYREKVDYYLELIKQYSEETYIHSLETANIALAIAKEMPTLSSSKQELMNIYTAGLLHDVGKVEIDKNILFKNGKLEPHEFEIVKKHPEYSYEILKGQFSDQIVGLCCHHHEKLNGKGYPHNLTETDLSKANRVLTIADITSALIMKRSYKEALDMGAVKKILDSMVESGEIDKSIVNITNNTVLNKANFTKLH
ncbi:MAG: HD domain-containing protein [Clostridia bacterium]|nr:HD domain-containing protein [Clostridia bacterium]